MTARTPEEVVAGALAVHEGHHQPVTVALKAGFVVACLRSVGLLAEPVDGDAREALADVLMSDAVRATPAMGRDYALVEVEAVIAAGWRPPALVGDDAVERVASSGPDLHQVIDELRAQLAGETVTTVEELDLLPDSTVILDASGGAWQNDAVVGWESTDGAARSSHAMKPYLPARVLFRPSTEGDDR